MHTDCMEIGIFIAIFGLFLCNLAAFWAAVRVGARVTKLKNSLPPDRDWETKLR